MTAALEKAASRLGRLRGQLSVQPADVCVVGGMVMDILAQSNASLQPGTSVPGRVTQTPGGVGRNIAEALALLGHRPELISVVGDDAAGRALLTHWRALGCGVDGVLVDAAAATPTVVAVFAPGGELAACVADCEAVEAALTWAWVERRLAACGRPRIVVLDANLDEGVLAAAARTCAAARVPVLFEPVSVAKSTRVASFVSSVALLKPNAAEAAAIAGALRRQGRSRTCSCASNPPRPHVMASGSHKAVRSADPSSCELSDDLSSRADRTLVALTSAPFLAHWAASHAENLSETKTPSTWAQTSSAAAQPDPLGCPRAHAGAAGGGHTAAGGERVAEPAGVYTVTRLSAAESCSCPQGIGAQAAAAVAPALPHVGTILQAGAGYVLLSLGAEGCAICCLVAVSGVDVAHAAARPDPGAAWPQTAHGTAQRPQSPAAAAAHSGGCCCCVGVVHVPALACEVVNVNGAGDCLVAGAVVGMTREEPLLVAVACGVAAAKLACESDANVPRSLDERVVMAAGAVAARTARFDLFQVCV